VCVCLFDDNWLSALSALFLLFFLLSPLLSLDIHSLSYISTIFSLSLSLLV
jgi:hypothetical protein